MLALVTGATGFVGSHVVDALLARGHRVRCTVRRTSDLAWLAGKPHEAVEGDLRDGRALDRAMEGVDAVYHVAGVLSAASLAKYRAGNWQATKHVCDAAVRARVRRLVQVSSLAATGPSNGRPPVDEETPCAPISMYGRTKLDGEREAWRHRDAIEVAAVRPPAVYGPRDRGLLDMFKLLGSGVRPAIGGPKRLSIVHVEDLARGIVEVGEHPRAAGEVFFLCNERTHSFDELMGFILAGLGRGAVRVPVPDRVVRLLGRVAEKALPLLGKGGLFSHDKAVEMTQRAWTCSPA